MLLLHLRVIFKANTSKAMAGKKSYYFIISLLFSLTQGRKRSKI